MRVKINEWVYLDYNHNTNSMNRGPPYTTWSDTRGEASRNDHVVTWVKMFFCIISEKDYLDSNSEQLHDNFLDMNL